MSESVRPEAIEARIRERVARELIPMIRTMATPPDFDDLIARGLLKKARGGWYDLLVLPQELPEQARHHVTQTRATPKGTQVKFHSAASLARFARFAHALEQRGVRIR